MAEEDARSRPDGGSAAAALSARGRRSRRSDPAPRTGSFRWPADPRRGRRATAGTRRAARWAGGVPPPPVRRVDRSRLFRPAARRRERVRPARRLDPRSRRRRAERDRARPPIPRRARTSEPRRLRHVVRPRHTSGSAGLRGPRSRAGAGAGRGVPPPGAQARDARGRRPTDPGLRPVPPRLAGPLVRRARPIREGGVALVDGRAVATWTIDRSRAGARVRLRPFGRLPRSSALDAEIHDVERFLAVSGTVDGS